MPPLSRLTRLAPLLLVPLLALTPGCAISYPRLSFAVDQRIIRETTLDDMPEGHAETSDSVVRVVRTGRSAGSCSGALIGPRHVLTAQHCVVQLDALRELTMAPLTAGELHVELGGGYLPWGRVSVREVHPCEGYVHDVAHDVAIVVLSKPVPADVPLFEVAYDLPREAAVFELAGFGSDTKAREIPLTGWYVSSVTRHIHRGPVITTDDGSLLIRVPGSPGDSGGPIVDTATGRIAGVVSRGRSGKTEKPDGASPANAGARSTPEDGDDGDARVAGARLMGCKKTIERALAR